MVIFLPSYLRPQLERLARLGVHRHVRNVAFLFQDVCDASFIREWGISTVGNNARPRLRMRVNMSEMDQS